MFCARLRMMNQFVLAIVWHSTDFGEGVLSIAIACSSKWLFLFCASLDSCFAMDDSNSVT